MSDKPAKIAALTPLQAKALELIVKGDAAHEAADTLGLTDDDFLDLVDTPELQAYVDAATRLIRQLHAFRADAHHAATVDELVHIASNRSSDPALRLRACITILRGPPPNNPSALRPLPSLCHHPAQTGRASRATDESARRCLPPCHHPAQPAHKTGGASRTDETAHGRATDHSSRQPPPTVRAVNSKRAAARTCAEPAGSFLPAGSTAEPWNPSHASTSHAQSAKRGRVRAAQRPRPNHLAAAAGQARPPP